MPHGAPDWYKYRITSATYPLDDLAELAARLRSIVTYDRRGDVIWMETFNYGLQAWSLSIGGTGASVALSPTSFLSHGTSLLVTCRSNGDFTNGIQNWLPYTPHGNIGLEAAFTLNNQHTAFTLTAYIYNGTTLARAAIRYSPATDTLDYLTTPTTYQPLTPTQVITPAPRLFNHIKLVINPATSCYVRAILNHIEYPLTGISYYTITNATTPRLYLDLGYTGQSGQNPIGYIDNVIVTEDEP